MNLASSLVKMAQVQAQKQSRKRKRDEVVTTYLQGTSRKAHRLRGGLKAAIEKQIALEPGPSATGVSDTSATSASTGTECQFCKPVLGKLKANFDSLVRTGGELRHSKRVLPEPRKLHYRNIVAQNEWIRANLFDALGNYRYCQRCINKVLGIGTQRLAHQRAIKRREALIPVVDMTKLEVANQGLQGFVMMPEDHSNFAQWWATLEGASVVSVRFPHSSHSLARRSSNFSKRSVREDFLQFVDANSQPNGRNSSSFGAQFYFLPKYSRVGEPKKGEQGSTVKADRSVICEFNRAQAECGKEGCSERSAFRWLKEHRPKHAICPPRTDYCDLCKELNEEINRQKTILHRLRHSGNVSDTKL